MSYKPCHNEWLPILKGFCFRNTTLPVIVRCFVPDFVCELELFSLWKKYKRQGVHRLYFIKILFRSFLKREKMNFLPQNQQETLVIPDGVQVYYLGQEKKKGVLCFSNKVVIGKVDCNTMLPYRAELPLHLLGFLIASIISVSKILYTLPFSYVRKFGFQFSIPFC